MKQKEIEERKRELRYKHQKQALADCIAQLNKIKRTCEDMLKWCKDNQNPPSSIAVSNLEAANEALCAVEHAKQNFLKEMKIERPAGKLELYEG